MTLTDSLTQFRHERRPARRALVRRSLVLDMVTKGQLRGEQAIAAGLLHQDLEARHGSSAGLIANLMAVRVDADRPLSDTKADPAPFDRLQRLLLMLAPHERELIGQLVRLGMTPGGKLSDLGISTGYEKLETRHVCLVGHVQALMRNVARFYAQDPQTSRHFRRLW